MPGSSGGVVFRAKDFHAIGVVSSGDAFTVGADDPNRAAKFGQYSDWIAKPDAPEERHPFSGKEASGIADAGQWDDADRPADPSGGPQKLQCPPTHLPVGIIGATDAGWETGVRMVGSIGLICRPFSTDPSAERRFRTDESYVNPVSWDHAQLDFPSRHDTSLSYYRNTALDFDSDDPVQPMMLCPPGAVLAGVTATEEDGQLLGISSIGCRRLDDGRWFEVAPSADRAALGSVGRDSSRVWCGAPHSALTTLHVRSGRLPVVEWIGAQCQVRE
jgi:hypothetical protein